MWTWYGTGRMRTHSRYENRRQVEAEAWDEAGCAIDPTSLPPINDMAELRRLFDGARQADRS